MNPNNQSLVENKETDFEYKRPIKDCQRGNNIELKTTRKCDK